MCTSFFKEYNANTPKIGQNCHPSHRSRQSVLRTALAAIANAEAPPVDDSGPAPAPDAGYADVLDCSFDARLALGGGRELVGDLEAAVAAHPFRERLRGHLAVALYRAGRQTDALRSLGLLRSDVLDARGRYQVARSDVEMWRERAAWGQRMLKKGYVSQAQVQADRARLAGAEADLRRAEKAAADLLDGR